MTTWEDSAAESVEVAVQYEDIQQSDIRFTVETNAEVVHECISRVLTGLGYDLVSQQFRK